MQSYMDKLSSDLQVESDFNRTIATSDPNFALISTNSASDVKRLPPLYHLRQIINYHDNEYCVNMIADPQKDDVYYLPSLLPTKKLQLYRTAYHQIGTDTAEDSAIIGQWFHKKIVDEDYLILQNQRGRSTLCTMFSLQKYTEQYPIPAPTAHSIVTVFSSDQILRSQDALKNLDIQLSDLQSGADRSHLVLRGGNLVLSYFLKECQTGVAVVTPL